MNIIILHIPRPCRAAFGPNFPYSPRNRQHRRWPFPNFLDFFQDFPMDLHLIGVVPGNSTTDEAGHVVIYHNFFVCICVQGIFVALFLLLTAFWCQNNLLAPRTLPRRRWLSGSRRFKHDHRSTPSARRESRLCMFPTWARVINPIRPNRSWIGTFNTHR
jgi:hypothetical protein